MGGVPLTPACILVAHALNLLVVPLLLVGVLRKAKALMQMRFGAPVWQPFADLAKLLRKGETVSATAGWVFRLAPVLGLSVSLVAALLVPWTGPLLPPGAAPATSFLLVLYLLALGRFLAMLAAMDTGSAFGGLGASREATLSVLVEPAMVIALGALALGVGSTELHAIYSAHASPTVAGLAAVALLIAALAELSRMPVDDPTTHLELTMVHEAMVLENSGRNLALIEYAVALRTCIFLGLAVQTVLIGCPGCAALPFAGRYALGLAGLLALACAVAVAEGVLVKLRWRGVPSFLAFATTAGLLAALAAAARI